MNSEWYRRRLQDAIDYIEENLSGPLPLHEVSGRANASLYHFHRLFRAFVDNAELAPSKGVLAPYGAVISNSALRKTIGLLFFVGFSTSGLFVYLGTFIQDETGLNLMLVGCILSAYGFGSFLVGTMVGKIRAAWGDAIFLGAGIAGGLSMLIFGLTNAAPFAAVPALFVYGAAFICIQSSIVASAQGLLPRQRGTVMSSASFTMVTSGAVGTIVNGSVVSAVGFVPLIAIAAIAFGAAGCLAFGLFRSLAIVAEDSRSPRLSGSRRVFRATSGASSTMPNTAGEATGSRRSRGPA